MRWIFSATTVLVVGGMVSWAAGADCCYFGQGGMYGDGMSALSAQPCGAPIYGYAASFCPETPRCVGIWDEYCMPKCRCRCRGCGIIPGPSAAGRGSVCSLRGVGRVTNEQTLVKRPSVANTTTATTIAPTPPGDLAFSEIRIRRLPRVPTSIKVLAAPKATANKSK